MLLLEPRVGEPGGCATTLVGGPNDEVAVLLLFEPRVGEPGDVATTLVGGLLFESGGGHRWQTYSPFACGGIGDKHSQQM